MIQISKPIIGDGERKAILDVLSSGNLTQGRKVDEFENEFSSYIGVKYSIAVANGTSALFLVLKALGIGKGDEVITTPFSFIATANSVLYVKAKPVFADVDPQNFNVNPYLIEQKINDRTKAILIVHLYGNPCDMDKILKTTEKYKLILIEDCCQAHGAEFKGKKVGSFGTGCFSFYATKNITTGEGGMVTTNDASLAEKIKLLRNHGSNIRYYYDNIGYNLRITDLQAAIGIEQLKKLDSFIKKRIFNAEYLNKHLNNIKGLITPGSNSNCLHVYNQYTVRITNEFTLSRDNLVDFLSKKGIATGVYYPVPIHKQLLYQNLGYENTYLPIAETLSKEVVSLPIHPALTEDDLKMIVDRVHEAAFQ